MDRANSGLLLHHLKLLKFPKDFCGGRVSEALADSRGVSFRTRGVCKKLLSRSEIIYRLLNEIPSSDNPTTCHCQGFLACERRFASSFPAPYEKRQTEVMGLSGGKVGRLPWFCWSAPSETKRDVLLGGAVVWKRTQATSKVLMSFKK